MVTLLCKNMHAHIHKLCEGNLCQLKDNSGGMTSLMSFKRGNIVTFWLGKCYIRSILSLGNMSKCPCSQQISDKEGVMLSCQRATLGIGL